MSNTDAGVGRALPQPAAPLQSDATKPRVERAKNDPGAPWVSPSTLKLARPWASV
ncbi:MAG: hypothetical protein LW860_01310 [Xanthomonadaceae bacterium]|jgi:hypothetical protein|nr:hypothetical protein [Xanthomonadaceae bacterium]